MNAVQQVESWGRLSKVAMCTKQVSLSSSLSSSEYRRNKLRREGNGCEEELEEAGVSGDIVVVAPPPALLGEKLAALGVNKNSQGWGSSQASSPKLHACMQGSRLGITTLPLRWG